MEDAACRRGRGGACCRGGGGACCPRWRTRRGRRGWSRGACCRGWRTRRAAAGEEAAAEAAEACRGHRGRADGAGRDRRPTRPSSRENRASGRARRAGSVRRADGRPRRGQVHRAAMRRPSWAPPRFRPTTSSTSSWPRRRCGPRGRAPRSGGGAGRRDRRGAVARQGLRAAGGPRVARAAALAARRAQALGVARPGWRRPTSLRLLAVVETPLLFEAGMEDFYDFTIAVVADEAVRAERAGRARSPGGGRARGQAAEPGGEVAACDLHGPQRRHARGVEVRVVQGPCNHRSRFTGLSTLAQSAPTRARQRRRGAPPARAAGARVGGRRRTDRIARARGRGDRGRGCGGAITGLGPLGDAVRAITLPLEPRGHHPPAGARRRASTRR